MSYRTRRQEHNRLARMTAIGLFDGDGLAENAWTDSYEDSATTLKATGWHSRSAALRTLADIHTEASVQSYWDDYPSEWFIFNGGLYDSISDSATRATIAGYATDIIDLAIANGRKVLYVSIAPIGQNAAGTTDRIAEFNTIMADISTHCDTIPNAYFLDIYTPLGSFSDGDVIKSNYASSFSNLLLTKVGATKVGRLINQAMSTLSSPNYAEIPRMLRLNGDTRIETDYGLQPLVQTDGLLWGFGATFQINDKAVSDANFLFSQNGTSLFYARTYAGNDNLYVKMRNGGETIVADVVAVGEVVNLSFEIQNAATSATTTAPDSVKMFVNGMEYTIDSTGTGVGFNNKLYIGGDSYDSASGNYSDVDVRDFFAWTTTRSNLTCHYPFNDGVSSVDVTIADVEGAYAAAQINSGNSGAGYVDTFPTTTDSGWVPSDDFFSYWEDLDQIFTARNAANATLANYTLLTETQINATSKAVFDMAMLDDVWNEIVELYPFALTGTDMLKGMRGDVATASGTTDAGADGVTFAAGTGYASTNISPSDLGTDGGGLGVWCTDFTYTSGVVNFMSVTDYGGGTRDEARLARRDISGDITVLGHVRTDFEIANGSEPILNAYEQVLNDLFYVSNDATTGMIRAGLKTITDLPVTNPATGTITQGIRIWGNVDPTQGWANSINNSDVTMSFALMSTNALNVEAFRLIMIEWLTALGQTDAAVASGFVCGNSNSYNVFSNGTPAWDGWDEIIPSRNNLYRYTADGADFTTIPAQMATGLAAQPTTKVIYMAAGINDIASDDLTAVEAIALFEANMMPVIEDNSLVLMLHELIPCKPMQDAGRNQDLLDWNTWLSEQDAAGRLISVPVHDPLLSATIPGEMDAIYQQFEGAVVPDGTHPAELGHQVLASYTLPEIIFLETGTKPDVIEVS